MGTGRKFTKTNITRPRKGGAAKRQRFANQRKRLIELGMDEEKVSSLNQREVRDLLKKPSAISSDS